MPFCFILIVVLLMFLVCMVFALYSLYSIVLLPPYVVKQRFLLYTVAMTS